MCYSQILNYWHFLRERGKILFTHKQPEKRLTSNKTKITFITTQLNRSDQYERKITSQFLKLFQYTIGTTVARFTNNNS